MYLKVGHYNRCGIEIIDVAGEIDIYTDPRLREILSYLIDKRNYQLVVNLEKVDFCGASGLGILVGGLNRVRDHDGSLDLVCTQDKLLRIFAITRLTEVFGIHNSVNQAVATRKAESNLTSELERRRAMEIESSGLHTGKRLRMPLRTQ